MKKNPGNNPRQTRLEALKARQRQSNDLSSFNTVANEKVRPLPQPDRATTKIHLTPNPALHPPLKIHRPAPSSSPLQILLKNFFRLAVVGIGFSVIVGTAIAIWNNTTGKKGITNQPPAQPSTPARPQLLSQQFKSEATALKAKISELAIASPDLEVHTLIAELDGGSYVDLQGAKPIASASMIKVPLLVAFLQDVDMGKVRLDEKLEISADVKVGESGDLQSLPLGTKISALETLTKMITISDNTATNMILKRLGGKEILNPRFKSWGLTATAIRNNLPDLTGTNSTSAQDLVNLMGAIESGTLLKPRNRDRALDILRRTETRTLLPDGINDSEARIAHKTGDIRSVVGDIGIIDTPNGKRYIMAAIVKRPDNDQRANALIRKIARLSYESLTAKTPEASSPRPPSPARPATAP